jgi:N-methylhydantoinase B
MSALDAASFNVITNGLHGVAREMGEKLVRSAYSTIIREAADCSTSLMDASGGIIAQAHMCPIHMNSFGLVWHAFAHEYDLASLGPGEGLITNDPYRGGQHLNDFVLFTPIHHEGVLVGFSASIGHHIDVGGGAAGPATSATEIYQEGLRLPLLRFDVEQDLAPGGWLAEIIGANVRVPDLVVGDVRAQVAANRTGATRLLDLIERFGRERVLEASAQLQAYSERLTRAVVEAIPDGRYTAEDFVDDNGFSDDPLRVAVAITVRGSDLEVDLAGSAPQTRGIVNSPLTSTRSAVLGALALVLGGGEIPVNEGLFRPVAIDVPHGSFLNPSQPVAVRARNSACSRVYNVVMRALADVLPDRVITSGHDTTNAIGLGHFGADRYRVYMEVVGGGWGASQAVDGMDVVDCPLGNCSNVPIEALESDHPYMRVEEYAIRQDSAGAGERRGGHGARRVYRILEDGVTFNTYSDRHRVAPWGLFGGLPGEKSRYTVERGGERIELPSKTNFDLRRGDRLVIEIAGGGGFGDPARREPEHVRRDVEDGYLSPERALEIYGFAAAGA